MLPSHLLDPTKKKNEQLSRTRLGHAPPPLPPSLCLTGAMSRMGRYRVVIGNDNQIIEGHQDDSSSNTSTSNGASASASATKNTSKSINDNNGVPIILSYCIFRPRQLHDDNKPPLLCLHGGPSIPSNYLLPIVNGVTDRAVIFYDQWGCGKSSRPEPQPQPKNYNYNDWKKNRNNKAVYPPFSIPTMVEHLRQLIEEHWKLKRFHLLGHSFGGILAYEYLLSTMAANREEKSRHSDICSLILSSTPTSAVLIQAESERLFRNLNKSSSDGNNDDDDDLVTNVEAENGGDVNNNKDEGKSNNNAYTDRQKQQQQLHQSMKYSEEFRQTHECRLPSPPLALIDALAQIGPMPWRGIQAIDGYEANNNGSISDDSYRIPPTLLMRGEYDFCTEACMKGWKERLTPAHYSTDDTTEDHSLQYNNYQTKVLSNCSHYAMLEDENLYGTEILRFLQQHD